MALNHFFLPHPDTHKKAHMLSWEALIIYILMFALLQSSLTLFSQFKPGVLGTSSNIQRQKVIELTNIERAKLGLGAVVENEALDRAAEAKAANMFAENYWAHFAPSGKTPWDFMKTAGYRYTFAGENLAKNFSESDTVVTAWMNSPSHKENVVNGKYKDIGVAVEDGILNGQRTTLVVQMFGTTTPITEAPVVPEEPKQITLIPDVNTLGTVPEPAPALFDPMVITKSFGLGMIGIIFTLLLIDLIVLKKRGVFRITSHHIAHMAVLGTAAAAIVSATPGSIL